MNFCKTTIAVALVAVLAQFAPATWGAGKQEKPAVPAPPSATIDFTALADVKLKSAVRRRLRLVVVADDGTTFDQQYLFEFSPGLDFRLVLAFSDLMDRCGGAADKGFDWRKDAAGTRLTVTAWKAGKGRRVPIKSVWIESPDASVPAVYMPLVKVSGGAKIAPPPAKPQKIP